MRPYRKYDDPNYYSELLEKRKGNLQFQSSYEKSKKAVSALLSDNIGKTKIDLVIEYLLYQCEDITPLALQKALYYVQGFYNEFLFSDDCEAWVHGPVYRDIYSRYRDYRYDRIDCNKEVDEFMFSSSEKGILDSVANNICCYSGKVLEKFTHSEMPWIGTRAELPENKPSSRIIQKEIIGEYFCDVKEKYNMINPNDIKEYANEMFRKI